MAIDRRIVIKTYLKSEADEMVKIHGGRRNPHFKAMPASTARYNNEYFCTEVYDDPEEAILLAKKYAKKLQRYEYVVEVINHGYIILTFAEIWDLLGDPNEVNIVFRCESYKEL